LGQKAANLTNCGIICCKYA